MQAMLVLTVKQDGGTQDVVGFYTPIQLELALRHAQDFLEHAMDSRRAIIRLELYNPNGPATKHAYKMDKELIK